MTTSIYDSLNMVAAYNGLWTVRSKYVFGRGLDEPLSVDQGGNVYYYHTDGLGSVNELTDTSGNTTKTYRYDSFGKITAQTGGLDQPFTFTGREYDVETGPYYYRARYYDPKAGRFISKDPIGFWGGDVNLFRYVGNDPENWVDPLGLQAIQSMRNLIKKWLPSISRTIGEEVIGQLTNLPIVTPGISVGLITASSIFWVLMNPSEFAYPLYEWPPIEPIDYPSGWIYDPQTRLFMPPNNPSIICPKK